MNPEASFSALAGRPVQRGWRTAVTAVVARASRLLLICWMPCAALSASGPPDLPKSDAERQSYATDICATILNSATANDLPEHFLARLIWQESLFDPGALSPKGAQGIAQFMPATARRRGLEDPYNPSVAVAAAAAYLAELKISFGNLGHAAAAYNAGEERTRRWLQGKGTLPLETQDYVLSITGHGVEEWKLDHADYPIAAIAKSGDFGSQCQSLVMRELSPQVAPGERAGWKPWGVIVSGGFSEARAILAFRIVRNRNASLIGAENPLVIRKKNLSRGRRLMVRAMIGRETRAAAIELCRKLTERGGACLVAKN
jgi:hypothetical protein